MSLESQLPFYEREYTKDVTNPFHAEENAAAYELQYEFITMGLIDDTPNNRWLHMCSDTVIKDGREYPLKWVDLRPFALTLRGWRGRAGVAMDVKPDLSPADLVDVYNVAKQIAKVRGLTVFIHEQVTRPIWQSECTLDGFLEVYARMEGEIPVPDLIGFRKIASLNE